MADFGLFIRASMACRCGEVAAWKCGELSIPAAAPSGAKASGRGSRTTEDRYCRQMPARNARKSPELQYNRAFARTGRVPPVSVPLVTARILNSVMRPFLILVTGLLLATGLLYCPQSHAQAGGVTPTADQLDIFRSLSPDQQQAILGQLSGTLSQGSSGTQGRNRQGRDQVGDQTDNNDRTRGTGTSDTQTESLIPVLKPDDTIVIEIDFHLAPRPQPTLPTSQYPYGPPAQAAGQYPNSGAPQGANPAQQQVQSLQLQSQLAPSGASSEPELTEAERTRLQQLIGLIRSRNPYTLSHEGVLFLPGFAGIPLAGLIEELATLRLKVEPALDHLDVRVTKLPLTRSGAEGLRPFGYDLFQRSVSTFAPVTNVPVPADYVIGAGDELSIQLYGNQNRNLSLSVGRDGRVSFPELGPIHVGGQKFTEVKANIEGLVARQLIGVRASVSMGDTRAIRVFVLGEANRPGSYTISGLGTISSSLFAAGGIKPIGSLRNIQLKRQGQIVRTLDLYDMLIRGDTTDDTKLLPGDVIFIPSVGPTVSVAGEVRRPAIYETKGEVSVTDMLGLAGGLSPEADPTNVMLTRIDEAHRRIVIQVDPSAAGKAQRVHNGDLVRVSRLRPTLDSGIQIKGHVFTTGAFAYHEGMRLSDVVHSVDELQPNADVHYLLIRRELPPDRRVAVLSADLSAALKEPGTAADVRLMPRDQITVFDLESGRDRVIHPILDELRLQSTLAHPTEVVSVDGRVKVPGFYPLEPGMKVSDLIRAGGSLQDAAYGGTAELVRYKVQDGDTRRTELITIDLAAVLHGDPKADLSLQPFDLLSVKETPQWTGQENVTLLGEVRFPGQYAVKRGETLKSVIGRAGGLTDLAFPEGSVFTRAELRIREQEQLDGLATRMQRDIALLALQGVAANQGNSAGALSVGQSLLSQLKATRAVGRLVIDLPRAMNSRPGSEADVILRDGDQLIVPKFQQEVTVIGEVPNQTSHLYRAGLSRDDYIALSGGTARRADKGRIYVVRANGGVVASEGNRWFENSNVVMKPGDTVVVPLDAEHIPALPFWAQVTQILYNVAIAAAAVRTF
jgi:polysaccharide export outer membrane protein